MILAARGVPRVQRNAVAQVRREKGSHSRAAVTALLGFLPSLNSALAAVAAYLRHPDPLLTTLLSRIAMNQISVRL